MSLFTIKIYKSWNAYDEENEWANEYEVNSSDTAVIGAGVNDIAAQLVEAEQQIHLDGVYFLRYTISTWVPDSKPYDVESFRSEPIEARGLRVVAGSDAEDRDYCFYVRRSVSQGRTGKLYYRGCLTEVDKRTRSNLKAELTPTSTLAPGGTAIAAYQGILAPYLNVTDGGTGLVMIHAVTAPAPGALVRPIRGLVPAGIVKNSSNHGHFNRTVNPNATSTPPGAFSVKMLGIEA